MLIYQMKKNNSAGFDIMVFFSSIKQAIICILRNFIIFNIYIINAI